MRKNKCVPFSFWSSYLERAGVKGRELLDLDSCYQSLGHTNKSRQAKYLDYLGEPADSEEINLIRDGLQRNQLTGNHRFVDEIECRVGIRIEKRGRGRSRHEEK